MIVSKRWTTFHFIILPPPPLNPRIITRVTEIDADKRVCVTIQGIRLVLLVSHWVPNMETYEWNASSFSKTWRRKKTKQQKQNTHRPNKKYKKPWGYSALTLPKPKQTKSPNNNKTKKTKTTYLRTKKPYMLSANILPVTFLERALVGWRASAVCIEDQLYTRETAFIYVTCHASTPPGSSMSSFFFPDLIREFASHRVLPPFRASWVACCSLTLWIWATHVSSQQPQSCLPDWRVHRASEFSLPGKLVNWAYIINLKDY